MPSESRLYRVALLAFFILPLVVTTLAFVSLANTAPSDLAIATPTPTATPNSVDLVEAGATAYAMGDIVEAERLFREALTQMPDSAELHNSLGLALFAQGDTAKSLGIFQQATKLDPTLTDAQFNLARSYHQFGNWELARIHYQIAIEQSQQPIYYHELGNLYHDMENDSAAEEAYLAAVALDSTFVESYVNLSTLYANANQIEAAIGNLERALTLKPFHHAARFNLATLHAFRGDTQQARAAWEAIVVTEPDGVYGQQAQQKLDEIGE